MDRSGSIPKKTPTTEIVSVQRPNVLPKLLKVKIPVDGTRSLP